MKAVSKSNLKSKMLEYFRQVEETGEELVVTDNRNPVLKVVPLRQKRPPDEVFSDARGKIRYHGDLLENTSDEWEDLPE